MYGDKDAGSTGWRRGESIEISWQVAAFLRIEDDLPSRGRITRKHFRAVHGAESCRMEGKAARCASVGHEVVIHDVVGVAPNAVVRIIAKIATRHRERIPCVSAGRVRRGGDSHALIKVTAG